MYQVNILSTVEELNAELCDVCPELYDNGICFEFISTGWVDSVVFCDHCLYCSEFTSEEEIDDAGGFKEFLIRERNSFINMLIKAKS